MLTQEYINAVIADRQREFTSLQDKKQSRRIYPRGCLGLLFFWIR